MSRDIKYIGRDVHKEAIVIAVLNGSGKPVIESIVETKASSILQFVHGLRGELHVTWEEGSWAACKTCSCLIRLTFVERNKFDRWCTGRILATFVLMLATALRALHGRDSSIQCPHPGLASLLNSPPLRFVCEEVRSDVDEGQNPPGHEA